jgi:hypothetical protein
MGEIVNLRRARKTKAREDAARAGDAARAKHGRRKAETAAEAAEAARAERALSAHVRDDKSCEGESDPEPM